MSGRNRRIAFAVAGGIGGATLAPTPDAIVAAMLLAAGGWRMAGFAEQRAARARAEAVRDALPESLDLLSVCALAGMGLDPAMRLVASRSSEPVAAVFLAGLAALDVGLPRATAYEAMRAEAATPEVDALIAALARADRYGAPLAEVLAAHAAESRERHLARVRERAMGAPVRMLFPLTLCFLPAFVLLAIAPSLIVAIRSFQGA